MQKRISSWMTTFYRVFFPIIWISGFGIGTLALWLGEIPKSNPGDKYLFLAAWIVGTSFILWYSMRLRSVWLEDETLLVRDLGGEYRVPLHLVRKVSESHFLNPKTITIHLDPEANVRRVVFMAPWSFQLPFTVHPMVRELRESVAAAQSRYREHQRAWGREPTLLDR